MARILGGRRVPLSGAAGICGATLDAEHDVVFGPGASMRAEVKYHAAGFATLYNALNATGRGGALMLDDGTGPPLLLTTLARYAAAGFAHAPVSGVVRVRRGSLGTLRRWLRMGGERPPDVLAVRRNRGVWLALAPAAVAQPVLRVSYCSGRGRVGDA